MTLDGKGYSFPMKLIYLDDYSSIVMTWTKSNIVLAFVQGRITFGPNHTSDTIVSFEQKKKYIVVTFGPNIFLLIIRVLLIYN